jgi:hypothetical protein
MTIAHSQMITGQSDDEASPELRHLYVSLLGAVEYLAHTPVLMLLSSYEHYNNTQPSHSFSMSIS